MIEVSISIAKNSVLDDVGRLTHYAGEKKDGDESAFDRISTTDSDEAMLVQFWKAACDGVTEQLKPFIQTLSTDTGYSVTLMLSSSYDTGLTGSVIENIRSCLALFIVSKWYQLSNKDEADRYGLEAAGQLTEAMRKIYYKKKPSRQPVTPRSAVVIEKWYAVSAVVDGGGGGSIDGCRSYREGDRATLTVHTPAGRRFDGWFRGSVRVSGNLSYTFTVSENIFLYARVVADTTQSTLSLNAGSGISSVSGGGTYRNGTQVTISAATTEQGAEIRWVDSNGEVWYTGSSVTVNVEFNLSLTAIAVVPEATTFVVSVERGDSDVCTGGGTASGGGTYYAGDTATLVATANEGSEFDHWLDDEGNRYTDNPLIIRNLSSDRHIWYYFRRTSQGGDDEGGSSGSEEQIYRLQFGISPGGGGVIIDRNDNEHTDGYDECLDGEAGYLTYRAAAGFHFTKWRVTEGGNVTEHTEATLGYTIDGQDLMVEAVFGQDTTQARTVTVNNGSGGGTAVIEGANGSSGQYYDGARLTVVATPNAGSDSVNDPRCVFDGWYIGDNRVSSDVRYTFTVNGNVTLRAKFTPYNILVVLHVGEDYGITNSRLGAISVSGTEQAIGYYKWYLNNIDDTFAPYIITSGHEFVEWALYDQQHVEYDSANPLSATSVNPNVSTWPSNVGNSIERLDLWMIVGPASSDSGSESETTSYTIQTSVSPSGGGTATVGGSGSSAPVSAGGNVILVATAANGYTFAGWYLNNSQVSSNASYEVQNVQANATYEARFTANGSSSGSGGDTSEISVYVTSNVEGTSVYKGSSGYGLLAGTESRIPYSSGMILEASNSGKTFDHWQDTTNNVEYSQDNPLTLTGLTSDLHLSAVFSS